MNLSEALKQRYTKEKMSAYDAQRLAGQGLGRDGDADRSRGAVLVVGVARDLVVNGVRSGILAGGDVGAPASAVRTVLHGAA